MSAATFKPRALEACGHFVRTKITDKDREGLGVAEVQFQYLPPGEADKYAQLFAAAPALADALEAFLEMPCGCSPREIDSGHTGDCSAPRLRNDATAALRAAGRLE